MRFLGFLFLSLLLSGALLLADYYIPGQFLSGFINNSYIETFAALVGLNITASVFLLTNLTEIELRSNNSFFLDNTRKEIKHSIYFLLIAFLLSFILLALRPKLENLHAFMWKVVFYALDIIILSLFLLSLYAIYELFCSAFSLNKSNKNKL